MIPRQGPAVLLSVALGLSILSTPLAAHVASLTDRQIAAGSPHVVVAVVESARSRWNEQHSLIVTDYSLRVEDWLRGDAPERITLTIPGGTLDGETHDTCVSTPLVDGARYLLYLQELEERLLVPVTGGWQGVFREAPGGFAVHGPGKAEAPVRTAEGGLVEFSEVVRSARELISRVEAEPEPADTAWMERTENPALPAEVYTPVQEAKYVVRSQAVSPLVFEPLSPGSPFSGVDQQMMAYWNLYARDLFRISPDPTPGWATRNGVSEIAGFPSSGELEQQLGHGWSAGALSTTVTFMNSERRIVEADIAWNPAYEWTLDETAATMWLNGQEPPHSFRSSLLKHLGWAWGYLGLYDLFSLSFEDVSRDSVMNVKQPTNTLPLLSAEDAAAARTYYPGRQLRDGLISPYVTLPSPVTPRYVAASPSVSSLRAGGKFDFLSPLTIENPGTESLSQLTVEVYLVPQRFNLARAVLLKRVPVAGSLPSGAAREVALGRVTVPKRTPPGIYSFAFVLKDARDEYQANNRAWSPSPVTLRVTR
ncbi:MAG TPA: hypothetical protein VMW27_30040 [Thermoanaerobaculia bacterium]|nr:hypothetical protein [Thermoanaerobaculia bacterium]